jgi:hypothetical protein
MMLVPKVSCRPGHTPAVDQLTLGLVLKEVVDLGGGSRLSALLIKQSIMKGNPPVVRADLEAFVVHVEDQVLALLAGRRSSNEVETYNVM